MGPIILQNCSLWQFVLLISSYAKFYVVIFCPVTFSPMCFVKMQNLNCDFLSCDFSSVTFCLWLFARWLSVLHSFVITLIHKNDKTMLYDMHTSKRKWQLTDEWNFPADYNVCFANTKLTHIYGFMNNYDFFNPEHFHF